MTTATNPTGAGLRWPLPPLLDATGLTPTRLAFRVTGGNQWAVRAAARDGLDDIQADRWAVRLGYHPAQIWDQWIDAGHDPARITADGPAYARIAAQLRHRIETGDLSPGERAPSSDTLAAETGVSPATAARALTNLTRDGLLTWAPHRGRTVTSSNGHEAAS